MGWNPPLAATGRVRSEWCHCQAPRMRTHNRRTLPPSPSSHPFSCQGRCTPMFTTRVRGFTAFLLVAISLSIVRAQPTPDEQAAALLNAGRKAYNEGNPQFAAEKFTELLTKFGGYKDANAARYGLGLALLDLPDRNYQKALEAFAPPASDAKFPEQALALYHAGVCQRGLGQKELAE